MAILVVDDRVNARHSWASTARLHGLQRRHGTAQEPTSLSLPPGVHDDGLTLANDLVIPQPHFRLDRFAYRGHVLEVVVVLRRLIRSGFAQHADGCWGRMEDIDVKTLGDSPGPSGVWVVRNPFVHHRGSGQ